MTEEQTAAFNAMIDRINKMPKEELDALVKADKCPYEPEHLKGVPMGMFHCDVCGEMVVAGMPHPRKVTGEE